MRRYICKKCGSSDNVVIGKPNWNNVGCRTCKTTFIIGLAETAENFDMEDAHNPIDHPKHYTKHPSGVECITVTEHFNFNRGNAIKYIWRAGDKGDEIEDLKKAAWYIAREIQRLERMKK